MYDDRHGGPYDRGSADAYYHRKFQPHYFIGATYQSPQVFEDGMTEEQIEAYTAGYQDQISSGEFKDWG